MNLLDISNLEKSSEMMDENQYWELIETSLQQSNSEYEQEAYLIELLSKLSAREMIGFRLRTDQLLQHSYQPELWCAAYLMNGGCSDDSFEYFRNWIISKGKKAYEKAKEHPDSLIELLQDDDDIYDFESFWYVALEAFQLRTGKELYDYIDDENFLREVDYPAFEFNWNERQPESMQAICPKLFERFWN